MFRNALIVKLVIMSALIGGPAFYVLAAPESPPSDQSQDITPEVIISPAATSSQPASKPKEKNSQNETTIVPVQTSFQTQTATPTSTIPSEPEATTTSPTPVDSLPDPVTPPPTTTPPEPDPQPTTTPKTAPRNGDPINPTIEEILSQLMPVDEPETNNANDDEAVDPEEDAIDPKPAPKKSTTTESKRPIDNQRNINRNDSDNSSATTSTTTPAAGTFERSTDGSNNQFDPENYYVPLDRLSPETTYGLSAIAAVLGIAGAFLVVRNPRPAYEEEEGWIPVGRQPRFQPQEPLLEP